MTRISNARRALCAATPLALALAASAQTALYNWSGEKANDHFGISMRSAGDVNGDGRPDVIVGAPESGNIFSPGEGFARVFSGANGSVLWTFQGAVSGDYFGVAVDGAGDVDGDGRADLIVGAQYAGNIGTLSGRLYLYSGATGQLIRSLDGLTQNEQFGQYVAGAGDVNNDGFDDVMAGSPSASGGGNLRGVVRVYSGLNGNILHTITGTANNERLGVSVDGVGDVNNDGFDDFVIGSYFAGARVYSGASGAVLWTFTAPANDRLGFAVAGAGDVDLDGRPDVLVGAPQDGDIFNPGNGYARIYSGASGALIRTLNGVAAGDRFGCAVASARDLNSDLRAEVLIGANQTTNQGPGYAVLYNGANGAELQTLTGLVPGESFGSSLDGLGNVNASGNMEVGVGAFKSNQAFTLAGRVAVFTVNVAGCPAPTTYCQVTPNSTGNPALMGSTGTTSIAANNFTLTCNGLPPGGSGLFFYGTAQTQTPFGNGFRCVAGSMFRLPLGQANGSGVATRAINYNTLPPGGGITAGQTRYFQYWYRNPAGGGALFNLSNGLAAIFCN
jgi:hypothetical protein